MNIKLTLMRFGIRTPEVENTLCIKNYKASINAPSNKDASSGKIIVY
jgi:hypothetical protein